MMNKILTFLLENPQKVLGFSSKFFVNRFNKIWKPITSSKSGIIEYTGGKEKDSLFEDSEPTTPEVLEYSDTPWALDKDQIKIIDGYSAQIIGVNDGEGCYLIEFFEEDMSVVEAYISKKEFINHPDPNPEIGTYFGLIIFQLIGTDTMKISAWPLKQHWNPELSSHYLLAQTEKILCSTF